MKAAFSYLFLLMLGLAAAAGAREPHAGMLGVGIQVGSMTGADLKFWLSHGQAVQVGLGNFDGRSAVLQAALLHHFYGVFHSDRDDLGKHLPLYLGVGGLVAGGSVNPHGTVAAVSALRGVGGVAYMFAGEPFDIFLELSPTFYLSPFGPVHLQAGLGGRYYF